MEGDPLLPNLCFFFACRQVAPKSSLADPHPSICLGYFGLAQNADSVIAITKNRDVSHLPGR